jgi:hypothetical protein
VFSFIFLESQVFSSLANNWILLWLLVWNLYFILSQIYKEYQKRILYSFIAFALLISVVSYTATYVNNKLLDKMKVETANIKKQISSIKSWSWIIKLDKSYVSPWWMDSVRFNISFKDNKVSNLKVEKVNTNSNSNIYIWLFNDEIWAIVKWKTLKELKNLKNIDVIWWASLTTKAFEEVIKKIQK